jgi:CubicO group peptidase (beta-lactamase class C family)
MRLKSSLVCLVIAGHGVLAAAWPRRADSSQQQPAPLDAFIDSLFADYSAAGAPGAAVLVAHGDRVVVQKAYGIADIATRARVDHETTFELASLTKPFTAVATLMLVQEGRLTLDENIRDVFPAFPAYGSTVTIRHLLSHTDGLLEGRLLPEARVGEAGVLARLMRADSTSFPPGQQFRYGNAGYGLLADIIVKRSGVPFGTYLRQRIFRPLQMHSTFVCGDAERERGRRARGHAKGDSGWRRVGVPCDPSGWLGAGGVVSSARDLLKFDQGLAASRLLPDSVLKDAFTAFSLRDGSKGPFGYGWMVRSAEGRSSVAHFGSMPGFRTYLTRYPDQRLTIIVLANRDPDKESQLPGPISIRIAERFLPPSK